MTFREHVLAEMDAVIAAKECGLSLGFMGKENFAIFLSKNCGKKFFLDEKRALVEVFKRHATQTGKVLRSYGKNALNNMLSEAKLKYKIISKQQTSGQRRGQRYWEIVPVDTISCVLQ